MNNSPFKKIYLASVFLTMCGWLLIFLVSRNIAFFDELYDKNMQIYIYLTWLLFSAAPFFIYITVAGIMGVVAKRFPSSVIFSITGNADHHYVGVKGFLVSIGFILSGSLIPILAICSIIDMWRLL